MSYSCGTSERRKLINHKLTALQCIHENISITNFSALYI